MDATIAEMTIADYDEVMSLWRTMENVGLSEADSRRSIESYLKRNPGLSLVARVGGRIVGAVMCGHDGRRGFLHHLAVAESARGSGLGKALVESVVSKLRSIGIGKCHIFILAANSAGAAFWKAAGWTERTELKVLSKFTGSHTL